LFLKPKNKIFSRLGFQWLKISNQIKNNKFWMKGKEKIVAKKSRNNLEIVFANISQKNSRLPIFNSLKF